MFNFTVGTVTKDDYPFLDKSYPTIRQWVALLVGAHASDETVYKYVKAIGDNQDRVQKIGGSLKVFTTAGMTENPAKLPVHPGALRYYKEKGLLK